MLRFDDDDDQPDPEAALFTLNLQRACDLLLEALLKDERQPANVDPDRDRYPRLFPTPFHLSAFPSPARMCADRGPPPEGADLRRR
jgi:hypothetical protein